MNSSRSKLTLIIIAIYLLVVVTCIYLAFDFSGQIDVHWTLVLIGLTLPWSAVSILFAWALIHGAGLEVFSMMYPGFAGINSAILYRLYSRRTMELDGDGNAP